MSYYKVTYDKLFPYAPFLNLRIGVEVLVETGQNPTDCLHECKKIVEDFYKESNPMPDENMVGTITRTIEPVLMGDESVINDINLCTELEGNDGLYSFKTMVKNNPQFKEAYNNKLKELQK